MHQKFVQEYGQKCQILVVECCAEFINTEEGGFNLHLAHIKSLC
jgi:hypothetical protein